MPTGRPTIKPRRSSFEVFVDFASVLVLTMSWAYLLFHYSSLPAIVPIHFNLNGEADGFGSKATLFMFPAIMTIVVIGLTIVNRYPHLFNYAKEITAENALTEYSRATRLIAFIKLMIVLLAGLMTFEIVESANAGKSQLPWWVFVAFISSIMIPVFLTMYKSVRAK